MSSYTQQVQKHTANSFCVYTKCEQNEYSKLKTYVGPNASEEFFKYLRLETQRIYDLQTKNCPMYLSDKVYATYKKAQRCYICDKPFTEKDFKVKDHNHLSGKYRGPARDAKKHVFFKPCFLCEKEKCFFHKKQFFIVFFVFFNYRKIFN